MLCLAIVGDTLRVVCRLGPLVAPLGCPLALLSEFMLIYVDFVVHLGSQFDSKINVLFDVFSRSFLGSFVL